MKWSAFIAAVFFTTCIFAQNEMEQKVRDEIKLNIPISLGGYIEGSYERLLNDESAFGVSFGFSVEDNIDYVASLVPYYRFYFGKKMAAGFFVEANAAFYGEEYEVVLLQFDGSGNSRSKSAFGAGLGMAIGGKFLNKKGWVGELVGGLGRNFLNTDNISGAYPRVGLSIGKRF